MSTLERAQGGSKMKVKPVEVEEKPTGPVKKNDIKDLTRIRQLARVNLDLDSPRMRQAMDNLGIGDEELQKKCVPCYFNRLLLREIPNSNRFFFVAVESEPTLRGPEKTPTSSPFVLSTHRHACSRPSIWSSAAAALSSSLRSDWIRGTIHLGGQRLPCRTTSL